MMKLLTAIAASVFIFLTVTFVVGLVLLYILPSAWSRVGIEIGAFHTNVPTLTGVALGSFCAMCTFKASFHAKTGKLYRKEKHRR